ncbi:MAG: hypothetical protein P8175_19795, partial [Deltaproteobacteria bacterium]
VAKRTAASHQSLQKSPTTPVFMSLDVNNLMLQVVTWPKTQGIRREANSLVEHLEKPGWLFPER